MKINFNKNGGKESMTLSSSPICRNRNYQKRKKTNIHKKRKRVKPDVLKNKPQEETMEPKDIKTCP